MSTHIQDKFGKVFVPKHERGGRKFEVLEGAKFSNLQLEVIEEGSEKPIYNGRRFHVGLLGVRLKISLPLGMNLKPDMNKLRPTFAKEIDMAKRFKIIKENDKGELLERKLEIIRNSGWSFYYSLTIPCYDWIEQDTLFVAAIFNELDDVMESFGNGEGRDVDGKGNERQKCKYNLVSRIAGILSDLLQTATNETFKNLTENPLALLEMACDENNALKHVIVKYKQYQLDDLRGILELLLNVVSTLRSSAISMGLKNNCSAEGFLYQSGLTIKACALQWSREWNSQIMSDQNATLMLPTMVALRQISAAGNYTLESAFLAQGIHLGNKLMETALFKLIYDKICSHTQKLNDIFSFEKEINGDADEWRNNEVGILHKMIGMSKLAALTKVADEANLDLDQLETLSELLNETWKDTPEQVHIENFITVLKRHVASHLRWSTVRNRYHNNLILDCYIDEI